MEMDLNKGIQIIDDTITLLEDKNDFAYFFIVGAGISVPEIPVASNIIDICKDKVRERGERAYQIAVNNTSPFESDPALYYSSWIENAFPNPINRSQFYKNLIIKSKISSANLMLAQILQAKAVTNTVFTTNFDDKIEQALDIIGSKDVFSSENKADNLVVNVNSDEIQIVHVHGTYRFYDIANLSTEVSDVSGQTEMISSSQLLRNFLQQKAPIVLGYSGWENDVIMKSIKERLLYAVPFKYIWVCFRKSDYDYLPNWLKTNNNVCFILPSDNTAQCDESDKDIESVFNQNEDNKNLEIPATLFLGKLIAQLKISPPKIFVSPDEYFSTMVENTLPRNEDVLHLRHWAQRMKYYAKNETVFEAGIKELEIALIGKDFDHLCRVLIKFSNMSLENQDLRFLAKCISTELLEDKYLIKMAPSKAHLLLSILCFIESYSAALPEISELEYLLYNLIFVRFKRSEKSDYRTILDKICELTKNSSNLRLHNTHLTALGVRSTISEDDSEKLALLDELLSKIPEGIKNEDLKHKEFVALLSKCELVEEKDAILLLSKAQKLYAEYSLTGTELLQLKTKSQLLKKITNIDTQLKWAKECLDEVPKYYSENCNIDILKIVNSIVSIPSAQLSKISDIEEEVTSILDIVLASKCNDENCECAIMVAETYLNLGNISTYKHKLKYYQDVLSLKDKFPNDCERYQIVSSEAHSKICGLPTIIVPDEIKLEHLKAMERVTDGKNEIYLLTIQLAAEMGDESFYSSELKEDFQFGKLYKALRDGVEQYANKKFPEAESAFKELIESGYNDISDSAFNNLAFMARRWELVDKDLCFEDLVAKVSDSNIFKHMNLLLYYLQKENINLDICRKAYNNIKCATQKDICSLKNCWSDESFVGEESAIGMAIINSINFVGENNSFDSLSTEKYDLDTVKTIISESYATFK